MRRGRLALARRVPLPVVRIACERCDRAGRYRLDGLVARFGAAWLARAKIGTPGEGVPSGF